MFIVQSKQLLRKLKRDHVVLQAWNAMSTLQKKSRKRLPASQGGPAAKKGRIAPAKSRDDTVKKRRHPVTLPVEAENDEESDEIDEEGAVQSEAEVEEIPFEKDEMVIDHPQKDPNGAKSSDWHSIHADMIL